jgi:hypothetical protein
MDRQNLGLLANGLQEFYTNYKTQLTQTERQAITKTVIALDFVAENLPEVVSENLLDSVLGSEVELEIGSYPVELEDMRDCSRCSDFVGGANGYCRMFNKFIEPFKNNGCKVFKATESR